MALIEAMAAGRTVVSTRVGGVPDVIDDGTTGRLVPPDDPTALADAMGDLLADAGLRSRLSAAARPWALNRYGSARLVRDVDRLYTRLLANDGRTRDSPDLPDRLPIMASHPVRRADPVRQVASAV